MIAFKAAQTPFDFKGRAARPEYWWFVLVMLAAQQVVVLTTFFGGVPYLLTLWILLFIVPYAAVLVRRLHDTDRSGRWGLLHLILLPLCTTVFDRLFSGARGGGLPDRGLFMVMFAGNIVYLLSTVVIIVFAAQDGTRGPNRYGPDPRNREPAL